MTHLTILHQITLGIFALLFILLSILSFRQSNKKLILPMFFSSLLMISTLSFFSLFVLDKYTKKAKLLRVTHKRILRNETISFSGVIKNTGKFMIGKCDIEVKIASNPMSGKNLGGAAVFNPKSTLSEFFNNKENGKRSSISKEFTIAKDLKPGYWKPFTVSMRFPSYMKNPYIKYKLYCH